MMKILIPLPPKVKEPFVNSLFEILNEGDCEVTINLLELFRPVNGYDILFIQWPECLFSWKTPDAKELSMLEECLKKWKAAGTKIVSLRHNYAPHRRSSHDLFDELYEIIYSHSDGILHLGEYSRTEFYLCYQKAYWLADTLHGVIPHPMFCDYVTNLTLAQARQKLALRENSFVILVFGHIRLKEEWRLILKTFRRLPLKNYELVVTSAYNPPLRFDTFFYKIIQRIFFILSNYRGNRRFILGKVSDKEVSAFLTACNMVFVPRVASLNSGLIYLGMGFEKVVVGPAIGNIKEDLIKSGNPCFDPFDIRTAKKAIADGYVLSQNNKGKENFLYLRKYHANAEIRKRCIQFFSKVMSEK